jgi:hypothetical protein
MNLNIIIQNTIREYITENIQLADKYYFNNGKLSNQEKEIILNITKGNNYTKIITDFFFYLKQLPYYTIDQIVSKIKLLYNDVVDYNKNVFPIVGYDVYNLSDVGNVLSALENRRKIIAELKKLPSVAIRNLKQDIRKERNLREFKEYLNNLEYFISHYSLLSNRDKDIQIKILKKMFKGDTTLDQLMRFVDDKENFIGGVEFKKEDININIEDNILIISSQVEKDDFKRTFENRYSIPDDVDIERINASMEDGILKLVIGKYAELPKTDVKKIEIK